MNIPRKYAIPCLLALSCLLSACVNLTRGDKPAITTWWLKPYDPPAAATVPDPVSPVVLSVSVVPGLDSNQVLALSANAELKPYAGAHWADYLPELTASLIGRSLEASGRFEILPGRSASKAETCKLKLKLTAFFANLDTDGLTTDVQVAIGGHLQCGTARPVDIQAGATIPVATERMSVIVAAFQRALDRVTIAILEKI